MTPAIDRRDLLRSISAAGLAAWADGAVAQNPEWVIGCTCPITGPLAASGLQYYYSLQMARDEINAAGGIAGKPLRMVFEDTRDSNASAVNAYLKITREHRPVAVLLSSYSTQNLATEPEVARTGIPVLYAGGADAMQERKNRWMFRIRPNDGIQGVAVAKYVGDQVKAARPAIIYIQNDFGQGVAGSVESLLSRRGIELVGRAAYGANDKDLTAHLLGFKAQRADAVIAVSYPVDGALLIKQYRQIGMTAPVIATSGLMLPTAINLMTPDEVAGLYGIVDAHIDDASPGRVGDYARRFRSRFKIKGDPFGSCYYDAVHMLKQAIETVGAEPEALRNWIAAINGWKGITNTYSADQDGNLVHSVALVTFKAGTRDTEFVATIDLS